MSEPNDGAIDTWLSEGGHGLPEDARADLVARIAVADRAELADLWRKAVAEWGDEASRLWQEGLSASDASDT